LKRRRTFHSANGRLLYVDFENTFSLTCLPDRVGYPVPEEVLSETDLADDENYSNNAVITYCHLLSFFA